MPGSSEQWGHYLPEGAPYYGGFLLPNLLLFGRVCKALGMSVTPNRMIEVAHALEHIDLGRREDVYHTLRALIVTHPREFPLFDAAFRTFWRRTVTEWTTLDLHSLGEHRRQKKTQFLPPPEASPDDSDAGNPASVDRHLIAIIPTYSANEVLRTKDFAEMTGEELVQAKSLIERLRWGMGIRKARRLVTGKGAYLDGRTALRRNMRYAGEPIEWATRTHKIKPRPLVLLCDISGSMERYTRLFLHFMHTLSNSVYRVESFVFSTRLTRITRPLRHKSIDVTMRQVGGDVKDWGGGTLIGRALHEFNYHWSRRVLGHGAVVLLITDGWDRGDPLLLQNEAIRLQRNAHRFVWLNPLIGAPQYEPLTRGALAMRPYVDDFLPVRNLANLEMLARELERVDWIRPDRPVHPVNVKGIV
jgi:uncharacterized protein with von Willebrand factor type A (vWA) domain